MSFPCINRQKIAVNDVAVCSETGNLQGCAVEGRIMQNPLTPLVMTTHGPLAGVVDGNIHLWRGIPYAAPPTGPLRWRAPQPVEPWQDVRVANTFSPASWQSLDYCCELGGGDPGQFSEDCLYLNVWSPAVRSEPLPVMVWLHGGGFTIGSGSLPPYDGKALAGRGVVVVTLNYRLGHLGFFAHPALENEDGERLYNFALLDQITALQWVRDNIAAFGGDAETLPCSVNPPGRAACCRCWPRRKRRGCSTKRLFRAGIRCRIRRAVMRWSKASRLPPISVSNGLPPMNCALSRRRRSGRWKRRSTGGLRPFPAMPCSRTRCWMFSSPARSTRCR
ncbi:hypothetical protein FHR25_002434 [Yokenella regensburgei]|nr:hypothetical protein FHR25_002434 [Yokenella regensburgei]